jgi:hypothetical protein
MMKRFFLLLVAVFFYFPVYCSAGDLKIDKDELKNLPEKPIGGQVLHCDILKKCFYQKYGTHGHE